jgi:hypothetical protein
VCRLRGGVRALRPLLFQGAGPLGTPGVDAHRAPGPRSRMVELQREFEAQLACERLWGPPEWLCEWTEQQRAGGA